MDFLDKRAPSGVLKDVSFFGGGASMLFHAWGSAYMKIGAYLTTTPLVTDFRLCWCRLGPELSENVPGFRNQTAVVLMGSGFPEAAPRQSLTLLSPSSKWCYNPRKEEVSSLVWFPCNEVWMMQNPPSLQINPN